MVDGGIGDVLVSNEVAGAAKLARLAALAKRATIGVCVDDIASVDELEAAADAGRQHARRAGGDRRRRPALRRGAGRRRRRASPSASPARRICASPACRPITARPSTCGRPPSGASSIAHAVACVQETKQALRAAGLEARIITGAGTGTYENEAASRVYNELQPGSYVFMDADYARNQREDGGPFDTFEHALFVQATVMSAPAPERRVIDAGLEDLRRRQRHADALEARRAPSISGRRTSTASSMSPACDERRRRVATRCCWCPATATRPSTCTTGTSACAAWRGNDPRVECVWPVAARGALF